MSMRACQQPSMQHIAQIDIIDKGRFAGDQFDSINFAFGLPNDTEISCGTGGNEGSCATTHGGINVYWRSAMCASNAALVIGLICTIFGMLQRRTAWIPGLEVLGRTRSTDGCDRLTAQDSGSS